jgi:hypothetical protein
MGERGRESHDGRDQKPCDLAGHQQITHFPRHMSDISEDNVHRSFIVHPGKA